MPKKIKIVRARSFDTDKNKVVTERSRTPLFPGSRQGPFSGKLIRGKSERKEAKRRAREEWLQAQNPGALRNRAKTIDGVKNRTRGVFGSRQRRAMLSDNEDRGV